MIVTRDNERMIKHIQPTPEDDPELILSSDNPRYAPFRRLKEDILKVFKVVYIGKNL
jgi:phage repressor protein C with HTH and peptisase S24 domain